MWLVVTETREVGVPGLDLPQLASFLRGLGIRDAIDLDDGGSTTIVARLPARRNLTLNPGGVVRDSFPVVEELTGALVKKDVADVVGSARSAVEHLAVDRPTQRVGGQVIPRAVADQCHSAGERVKRALDAVAKVAA
jgi:Phosphodiester glycosidase